LVKREFYAGLRVQFRRQEVHDKRANSVSFPLAFYRWLLPCSRYGLTPEDPPDSTPAVHSYTDLGDE